MTKTTQDAALDRAAVLVSGAADRSGVWLVTALGLSVLGGTRGRRAALRGVMSIGLASLVANAVLKPVLHTSRPSVRPVVRRPRSFSFPSGHTASAFAFATAVGSEIPVLAAPLAVGAFAVAWSRVRGHVHYRSDVIFGALLGVAAGAATGAVSRRLAAWAEDRSGEPGPYAAVMVLSPHAGRAAKKLDQARAALAAHGVQVAEEVTVDKIDGLAEAVRRHGATHVVAAGGDGTVGAVADSIANSQVAMLVMPLGTSNDFARSLEIPMRLDDAAALARRGRVSTIDIGRVDLAEGMSRRFVHAATIGLNVNFAKLATRASLRQRFGRLTYAVAGALALRDLSPFDCGLAHDGQSVNVALTQLSVINAPVFGGFLGLRVIGSSVDDGALDVLVAEALPPWRTMLAALYQLVRVHRPLRGIHPFRTGLLNVRAAGHHEVSVDGELAGEIPCSFTVERGALRVVTPRDFGRESLERSVN